MCFHEKQKKKRQFVTEPSQEKIEECWTEGLFMMEEICSGHLAQLPSQSFWFACCCSSMVIWLLLSYHPFHWPESLGSRIKCFLPVFKFLLSYKVILTGQPFFLCSHLHPPSHSCVNGRQNLALSELNEQLDWEQEQIPPSHCSYELLLNKWETFHIIKYHLRKMGEKCPNLEKHSELHIKHAA